MPVNEGGSGILKKQICGIKNKVLLNTFRVELLCEVGTDIGLFCSIF